MMEERLRSDSYIGLFRALPHGKWKVRFPDLPGCEATGSNFKEVFVAARHALARHLSEMDRMPPRARSSAELLIDAQRDWKLCQDFVDAVMHPVEPLALEDERAPLGLVAAQMQGGGASREPQPAA
jgi:predicted RNase H-like HicB family nuclease